jgi:hypothetical protein
MSPSSNVLSAPHSSGERASVVAASDRDFPAADESKAGDSANGLVIISDLLAHKLAKA